jgi:hypothetical protein
MNTDHEGLTGLVRHVIQRIMNPGLLTEWQQRTLGIGFARPSAVGTSKKCSPHHYNDIMNPRFFSQMASYDVTSDTCQAIARHVIRCILSHS